MTNHPWHDVTVGKGSPDVVNAITEIPKGNRVKYELDKESGMLVMDRILYSPVFYPANYGFIPQTFCDDGDPLDILILTSFEIVPMCLVKSRVIGVMKMIDGGEMDDKVIAVPEDDITMGHVNELDDLPGHSLDEIRVFFEDYKKLEKKEVKIEGFFGREKAIEIVEQSIIDYKKKFNA